VTNENKKRDMGQVIERGIDKYRRKMEGAVLHPPIANRVATKDCIRRFADGLGDANPLWRDEDYARAGIHGGLIAPPGFLVAVSEGQAIVGLPGLVSTFVGAEWEWSEVIREGDQFTVTNRLLSLQDKTKDHGPRRLIQSGVLSYENQAGRVIGRCTWTMMRSEVKPGSASGSKETEGRPRPDAAVHRYSESELAAIYADIEAEEIRGSEPRCFEDVTEGDELRPVVKGPLSLSDMVAWAMGTGWHRMSLAHGPKLKFLRANPGLAYVDPDTGAPEPIANSHFQPAAARILMGSPLPLDVGFQRVCWLSHLMTNWMGDTGFLRRLSARLTGLVCFGDTNWCRGRVVRKWRAGDENLVEAEVWCRNQRQEITATGQAVMALPARRDESVAQC
jgi:acyl dehydratase